MKLLISFLLFTSPYSFASKKVVLNMCNINFSFQEINTGMGGGGGFQVGMSNEKKCRLELYKAETDLLVNFCQDQGNGSYNLKVSGSWGAKQFKRRTRVFNCD